MLYLSSLLGILGAPATASIVLTQPFASATSVLDASSKKAQQSTGPLDGFVIEFHSTIGTKSLRRTADFCLPGSYPAMVPVFIPT